MQCPHCRVEVNENWVVFNDSASGAAALRLETRSNLPTVRLERMYCPQTESCARLLVRAEILGPGLRETWFVYPRNATRPVDPAVDEVVTLDYLEAAAVLPHSAKASTTLSRRVMQHLLREEGDYEQHDLSKQIDAFIADASTPQGLKTNLDYVREIGNFAAHVQKSTNTGAIMDVEPGEAEWCLDVLDGLFEHYFVGPKQDAERRTQFAARLEEAGRRQIEPEQ